MARPLVVDHEDVMRQVPQRLSGASHRVPAAGSAEESRTAMCSGRPEVLVSDMRLPGGSRLSLVTSLRGKPPPGDLPVGSLSGRALPGDDAAGGTLPAVHLTEPASPAALEAAIEAAIDAAIQASPPALMAAVRDRLTRLGADDGEEGRALVALLLDLFVAGAPARLAAVEAALEAADDTALEVPVARLGSAAAQLGAAPLVRLCADLEHRARSGSVPPAAAVRATLRRELTVTCRVLRALAAELAPAEAGDRPVASVGGPSPTGHHGPAPCPAWCGTGRL